VVCDTAAGRSQRVQGHGSGYVCVSPDLRGEGRLHCGVPRGGALRWEDGARRGAFVAVGWAWFPELCLAEGRRFEVVMLSQSGVQYSDSRIYFVRLHGHSSRDIVGSLRYVVSSRDCLRTVSAVLSVRRCLEGSARM